MSDLKSLLAPFKQKSRYHRDDALEAVNDDELEQANKDFKAAAAAIIEAIDYVKTLGAPDPKSQEPASEAEIMMARELADCWGILGGVYRAHGREHWADAIAAYDEGNKYESSTRFNILSTYNRVNRLVLRILKDPNLLSSPPPLVSNTEPDNKTMSELLSEADSEIERQLRAGRTDRAWALADLAMVRLLGGSPKVEVALNDLDASTGNDLFPYESMLKVIRELVAQNLPMHDHLISVGERLRSKLPPMLRGERLSSQSMTA